MMWNKTQAAARLGIEYPIVQGPFGGGVSSTALASTVSNAGGLGSFGADGLSPDAIVSLVSELRALTDKPFAVNLWVPREVVTAPTEQEFEANLSLLDQYYEELEIERPANPGKYGQDFPAQVRALLEVRPPAFKRLFFRLVVNVGSSRSALRPRPRKVSLSTVQESIASLRVESKLAVTRARSCDRWKTL
jgi:nitronate monooxygenase